MVIPTLWLVLTLLWQVGRLNAQYLPTCHSRVRVRVQVRVRARCQLLTLLWQVGKYCAFNTYLPHFDIDGVCVHKYPWKLLASQGQNHTVP